MDLIDSMAGPEGVHRPGRTKALNVIDVDARMDSQRDIEILERATNLGDHIEKSFDVIIRNVEGEHAVKPRRTQGGTSAETLTADPNQRCPKHRPPG